MSPNLKPEKYAQTILRLFVYTLVRDMQMECQREVTFGKGEN